MSNHRTTAIVDDLEDYERLVEVLGRLSDRLDDIQSSRNAINVTHTQSGIGNWATAAIVACFCTWFGLILMMFDLHDLRAWVDVLKQRVTMLESKHQGDGH